MSCKLVSDSFSVSILSRMALLTYCCFQTGHFACNKFKRSVAFLALFQAGKVFFFCAVINPTKTILYQSAVLFWPVTWYRSVANSIRHHGANTVLYK